MPACSRRAFALAAAGGLVRLAARPLAARPPDPPRMTLGYSTYATRAMPCEQAIGLIGETGFDALELAVQPGYDAEPARCPAPRRADLRRRIAAAGLRLTSLMEHLEPQAQDPAHGLQIDRLKAVAALARDLADRPPLVQTVLGGGDWDAVKNLFRDRVGDWLQVTRAAQVLLCVKPHRFGALSRPVQARWLIEQHGHTPWLRMVYDYSHYAFRGLSLPQTVEAALPITAHVAVKDAVRQGEAVRFVLPGEGGTPDHAELLRLLAAGGYAGDVNCEVSGMVSGQPGYDPSAAARTCYRNLSRAFQAAGVDRPPRP